MACVAISAQPIVASAAEPSPPYILPTAHWLSVVNYYRAMAGLPKVAEDPALSPGAYNHSCYMLYNGISHDETPGLQGYTTSGDTAGNQSNVAVSSGYGATARNHIDLWMTGPFHAIGVLRHNLKTVGFGKCDLQNTPTWHSGATLNVIAGLASGVARPTTPILFPGNGTTTSLNRFIAETPNPVKLCGWTGSAGLPVIAMMPEAFTSVSSATITGPTGPLQTCNLHKGNANDATAKAILGGDNAVTVIPRTELLNGIYTVKVVTNVRTVQWSFTVDSAAADGIMPMPQVTPLTSARAYTTITPFRLADSRKSYRITKLLANVPKLIRVAGVAGIPTDVTALSANFTALNAAANGYLTIYNCTATRPNASTITYYKGEVTPNAGLFPLSSKGELCLYSPQTIDLIIDVNGYFRPSSTLRYQGEKAIPLVDTRTNLRSTGRLVAGQTLKVNVPSAGIGVPSGAAAVALNITGSWPDVNSFITAYPCGVTRPVVSNLNPSRNVTKQNFAIVKLPANGDLCVYVPTGMHVKLDVLGYFGADSPHTMTPTTPTRVVDTRDSTRALMNMGTAGFPLAANTTKTITLAGDRGIPTDASVISANVTVVSPGGTGSLTMWDCGTQPPIQSLNYRQGRSVANGVQVQLSTTGTVCIRSTAATHVVVDVTGWWT
jgi:hypothetical protein